MVQNGMEALDCLPFRGHMSNRGKSGEAEYYEYNGYANADKAHVNVVHHSFIYATDY